MQLKRVDGERLATITNRHGDVLVARHVPDHRRQIRKLQPVVRRVRQVQLPVDVVMPLRKGHCLQKIT